MRLARIALVLLMVLLALAVNPVVPAIAATTFHPFRVEGESMLPGHEDGDFLLVATGNRHPSRGDVVIFDHPRQPGTELIKRVIGLPGEVVEIVRGRVFVDGRAISEPYVKGPWDGSLQAVRVPEDSYFVMGDNRNNSTDSRELGPIPGDLLVGGEVLSYWPLDRNVAGFSVLALVLTAWVGAALASVALTAAVALRRGRSAWWCMLSWVGGAIGLLAVYLFVERREAPAAS